MTHTSYKPLLCLLRSRTKLLYYLDCLDTLEDILGGAHLAAERYSPAAFRLLRSHSPLENCARAAKQGLQIKDRKLESLHTSYRQRGAASLTTGNRRCSF